MHRPRLQCMSMHVRVRLAVPAQRRCSAAGVEAKWKQLLVGADLPPAS